MVDTIQSHVVLPHPVDWSRLPEPERHWQDEVSTGVTGAETRCALRDVPRRGLGWRMAAWSVEEMQRMLDRLSAAKKSGLACAPIWGRGSEVKQVLGPAVIELEPGWSWQDGDTVFYLVGSGPDAAYETRTVQSVNGSEVTLDAAVDLAAGALVWPMIFGRFECEEVEPMGPSRAAVWCAIREMTAAGAEAVGEYTPVTGEGVGYWAIGTDFEVS